MDTRSEVSAHQRITFRNVVLFFFFVATFNKNITLIKVLLLVPLKVITT